MKKVMISNLETGETTFMDKVTFDRCRNRNKLSKEQEAAADLQKIIEDLDECAYRLYHLSFGVGMVNTLQGQMMAYANVISNICTALISEIE